ncbi:hypothetical protein GCM10023323_32740 [Streptomyces thinghirensis]|uniref:Uncharacterized protein n=1 Tax=Streptomyces thinghirensis TaxID=551547 RepID=A0ABP9T5K4_9ACTN
MPTTRPSATVRRAVATRASQAAALARSSSAPTPPTREYVTVTVSFGHFRAPHEPPPTGLAAILPGTYPESIGPGTEREAAAPVPVTVAPCPVHLPFTLVTYVRPANDLERLPG